MDYPHQVAPRKIRFSRRVQLVPQLGHGATVRAMAFHPERPRLLAALDAAACLRVWAMDVGDVVWISPLPPGDYDAVRWTGAETLAVRRLERPDDAQDSPSGVISTWYVCAISQSGRWKAVDGEPAPLREPTGPRASFDEAGAAWLHLRTGAPVALQGAEPGQGRLLADPLGRYALQELSGEVRVFDSASGRALGRFRLREGAVTGVVIEPRGAWVVHTTDTGEVVRFDPMRPEELYTLASLGEAAWAPTLSPDGQQLVVAETPGHLQMLSPITGQRLLRTPRRPPGFGRELTLRERAAFVGVRGESITAYLAERDVLLPSAPLPQTDPAVCAAREADTLLVARDTGTILAYNLHTRRISGLLHDMGALRHIAACQGGVVGLSADGLVWAVDRERHATSVDDAAGVRALSADDRGRYVALLRDDALDLWDRSARRARVDLSGLPRVHAMAIYKRGTRRWVALVDDGGVLWRASLPSGKLRRVGVIALEPRHALGRALDLLADDDGTLRLLSLGTNDHRLLSLLDPTDASARLLMGVISIGGQLIEVHDEEGTWLRDPDELTLRVVDHLRSFEIQEWRRQPDANL